MLSKFLRTLAFVALVALIASHTVTAQQGQSSEDGAAVAFGVFPEGGVEGQFFEATVEAGGTHEFRLAILNAGDAPLALVAYPASAYSLTNGGLGVAFQDEPRINAASWIEFPEGSIELQPGEQQVIPFTVVIPDDATPGQHVAALGVETAESYAVGEGDMFRQVLRKVIAIAIMVPGPIEPSFELGQPLLGTQEGQTVLSIPVTNSGNIRVRPAGPVTITDLNGTVLATGEASMGSVYAGDTAAYELWMPIELPVAEYLISADFMDLDTGAVARFDDKRVMLEPEPVETPVPAATPVPVTPTPIAGPVTVPSVGIEPNADPIQFANVEIVIANTGDYVPRSRATLVVSLDGELIEEFELDDFLPLPVGETTIQQRYIPPTGWSSGTWSFGVVIHAISANADSETLLVSVNDVAELEVP